MLNNALSMENILETLREYQPNRLICLFGAGGNRCRTRRFEIGGGVRPALADLSVITADNSRFDRCYGYHFGYQGGHGENEGNVGRDS